MGFHPEFTGRENARLNAALLGLSSGELRRRLPEIREFAELGEFFERPVRTYSSGWRCGWPSPWRPTWTPTC
jgi:lipopolysaccharide transport system ATP-binding protein